jgi:hypothetical protein
MRRLVPLLFLVACQGPGPSPSLDTIERALVCNVPGAAFDVHGMDLSRAHIQLQRQETVVGVTVSEDPFNPPSSHSGSALHISLDGTGAQPGAYDVTAISPGGQWTVKRGLALLQPPSVTSEMPSGLCDAQAAQTLVISGDGFFTVMGQVPTVSIRDAQGLEKLSAQATPGQCVDAVTSVLDGIQLCNQLSVAIPQGALDPGVYVAVVTNPSPLNCSSTDMKPFIVGAPPSIDASQSTATLCQGGGSIDIKGSGFAAGASLTLGTGMPDSTTVVGDGEITASFGFSPLLVPGQKLSVVVANPDGCRANAAQQVSITAGPVLLSVDPPFAYKSYRTGLVLQLSSVTKPLGQVTLTSQSTGVPVTLTAAVDVAHLTRVNAQLPPGLGAGQYALSVVDGSGCGSQIERAITIVDTAVLPLSSVEPPSGDRSSAQHIRIISNSSSSLTITAGARAYLAARDGGGSAIIPLGAQLESGVLHAVVPAGIDAGLYDVMVVNPDGAIGILNGSGPQQAYQAIDGAPPLVTRLVPEVIEPACGSNCRVEIDGSGFGAAPSVSATCWAPGETSPLNGPTTFSVIASPTPSPSPGGIVIDAAALSSLKHGTRCTLYVANHDGLDATFGESDHDLSLAVGVSAIGAGDTAFELGSPLATGRRAPAVVVAEVLPRTRFLYAFGGDGGSLTSGRADGEVAPLGLVGPGAFTTLLGLGSSLTLAGAVAAGRFIFLIGGHDGAASLATVSRAEVLSPVQSPSVDDVGVQLDFAGHGLAGATYYYRVSARFADSDPLDPGGESLASPTRMVVLPALAQNRDVSLGFSAGDTTGRALAGFRLYRGQSPDQLDRAVDLPLDATSFLDDDTMLMSSAVPLPLGSIGHFTQSGVPQLNTPRAGAAVVAMPGDTPGSYFFYAGYGWNSTSATALPASYEVLRVDATDQGTDFAGATHFTQQSFGSQGRWLAAAFIGTPERDSTLNARYVYFGQGTSNLTLTNFSGSDSVAVVNAGDVAPDGTLSPFKNLVPTVTTEFGYGAFSGGDSLVMVGGANDSAQPLAAPWRAQLGANAPFPDAWTATAPLLPQAHFLPGVATDGPYLIVIGGTTAGLGLGSSSPEVSFGLY